MGSYEEAPCQNQHSTCQSAAQLAMWCKYEKLQCHVFEAVGECLVLGKTKLVILQSPRRQCFLQKKPLLAASAAIQRLYASGFGVEQVRVPIAWGYQCDFHDMWPDDLATIAERYSYCWLFLLIPDEATDICHAEQMCTAIFWMDLSYTIQEGALSLIQLPNTKAMTLFNIIKDVLLRYSLSIAQMHWPSLWWSS